jgi:hypothetical protein
MKTNWSDYEMYLKPVHLKGQAVTVTIVKATEEETHPQRGKSVVSPVLWFREIPFGLILSPTNRQTLIALYGDRVSDCIGKPIVIKAVKEKVAGRDKEPIRIQNVKPNAPKIEPSTGEIVEQPEKPQPEKEEPDLSAEGEADLEKYFGPNPRSQQPALPVPSGDEVWPTTEAEYTEWTRSHGINGKETYSALGESAAAWMRKNRKGWADVAKTVQATLGKI